MRSKFEHNLAFFRTELFLAELKSKQYLEWRMDNRDGLWKRVFQDLTQYRTSLRALIQQLEETKYGS
jgi:hypothetical protein